MDLVDKILVSMFFLGIFLLIPATYIDPWVFMTCLSLAWIGAVGFILKMVWEK